MLIGTKVGMTQLFTDEGRCVPVTQVSVQPATVLRQKTVDSDGYESIQVGYGSQKEARLNKARKGEVKEGNYRGLKEFRLLANGDRVETIENGVVLDASQFTVGDKITVSAISKAKGFQGVVKRWNFAGGPKSHGQKHTLRTPGSIGAGGPQRVFKNLKMAGRTGGDRITVKNLEVAFIDNENNLLYVKGAVPGRRGTLVEVVKTPANKKKQS
jgi:large subunit ribosomal protein L3